MPCCRWANCYAAETCSTCACPACKFSKQQRTSNSIPSQRLMTLTQSVVLQQLLILSPWQPWRKQIRSSDCKRRRKGLAHKGKRRLMLTLWMWSEDRKHCSWWCHVANVLGLLSSCTPTGLTVWHLQHSVQFCLHYSSQRILWHRLPAMALTLVNSWKQQQATLLCSSLVNLIALMFTAVSWLHRCMLSQWAYDHMIMHDGTCCHQLWQHGPARTLPHSSIPKGPSWLQCHEEPRFQRLGSGLPP